MFWPYLNIGQIGRSEQGSPFGLVEKGRNRENGVLDFLLTVVLGDLPVEMKQNTWSNDETKHVVRNVTWIRNEENTTWAII